jgi:hypothetical protein
MKVLTHFTYLDMCKPLKHNTFFCKTMWNSRESIKINNEKVKTITTPELSLQSSTWNTLDTAEEICLSLSLGNSVQLYTTFTQMQDNSSLIRQPTKNKM